jgi:hypothetical protein
LYRQNPGILFTFQNRSFQLKRTYYNYINLNTVYDVLSLNRVHDVLDLIK